MRPSHFYVVTWSPERAVTASVRGIFESLAGAKRSVDRRFPLHCARVQEWRGQRLITGYERGAVGGPLGTWGEELPF